MFSLHKAHGKLANIYNKHRYLGGGSKKLSLSSQGMMKFQALFDVSTRFPAIQRYFFLERFQL